MKKRIKYAVITILAVFIAVNIADFIMFQRFKSICKQEMSILNREDSFSDENNKKWHYKIFCVNGNTGFRNESRIFYFIHLQNEEAYERKESSSA